MQVIRRYSFVGASLETLRAELEQTLKLDVPEFVIVADLAYDDAEADVVAADEAMAAYGWQPEVEPTLALSPNPFIGLVSPDGSVWKLSASDLGVISSKKVSQ